MIGVGMACIVGSSAGCVLVSWGKARAAEKGWPWTPHRGYDDGSSRGPARLPEAFKYSGGAASAP